MAKSKSKKKGGSGTKVGNAIRKVTTAVKKAAPAIKAAVSKVNVGPGGGLATVIRAVTPPKKPNLVQEKPMTTGVQTYAEAAKASNTAQRAKETATATRFTNTGKKQVVDEYEEMPDYGNDMSEEIYANDGEDTEDGFTEGMGGSRVQPGVIRSKGPTVTSMEDDDPFVGGNEKSNASVAKSSLARVSGGAGLSSSSSGGVASSQGAGSRKTGIAGTLIDDPVYRNLVSQYRADAQLDIDEDEIRDRVLSEYQPWISSVNSVYEDIISRGRENAKIREGSERALQSRSGVLGSTFGLSEADRVRNVGMDQEQDIRNEQLMKLQSVYADSRNSAQTRIADLREMRRSGAEGYMESIERERAILDEGLGAFADNFVEQGFTVADIGEKELATLAKDWKTSKEMVYNTVVQKQREAKQRQLDTSEQEADIAGDADEDSDLTADQFLYESNMLDLLPTQIRNSDKEREYYINGIRALQEEGYSDEDAYNQFMGYTVNEPTNLSESIKSLIPQSTLSKQKIKLMANEINKGNEIGAIQLIENDIMARAKKEVDDFISEPTTKTAVRLADEVQTAVEGTSKGAPLGVVSGTMQKWLKKLKKSDQAKVETAIVNAVKEMRKRLSGSAVTPAESAFLEPLIPDLNDKPDVFWNKVLALQDTPIMQLNNIRNTYGIPEVDKNALLNNAARVQLYGNTSVGGGNTQSSTSVSGGGDDIWDF